MHRLAGLILSLAALALTRCEPPKKATTRARLEETSGTTFKIIPAEGQLPYCIAVTASERDVTRLLTENPKGESIPCPANKPVGGVSYRVVVPEGRVRVIVVFTEKPIATMTVAQQIREVSAGGRPVTAMDLRAPGNVTIETLVFTPSIEAEGVTVIGSAAPKAGAP